jgi:hypothetical protein
VPVCVCCPMYSGIYRVATCGCATGCGPPLFRFEYFDDLRLTFAYELHLSSVFRPKLQRGVTQNQEHLRRRTLCWTDPVRTALMFWNARQFCCCRVVMSENWTASPQRARGSIIVSGKMVMRGQKSRTPLEENPRNVNCSKFPTSAKKNDKKVYMLHQRDFPTTDTTSRTGSRGTCESAREAETGFLCFHLKVGFP